MYNHTGILRQKHKIPSPLECADVTYTRTKADPMKIKLKRFNRSIITEISGITIIYDGRLMRLFS